MRRTVLFAVAAVLLLAPASAGAATVTIAPEGESPVVVDLANVAPDVNATYSVASGSETVSDGRSLDAVIRAGGEDAYLYKSIEVSLGGDGGITLTSRQVTDRSAFADGPPVMYEQDGDLRFIRPAGSDGGGGVSLSGGLTVRLRKDPALAVEASAAPKKVDERELVRFEAEPLRQPDGEVPTYSWYFDDNTEIVTGQKVRHRFKKAGSYDVLVTMRTASDQNGQTDVVSVQVGEPREGGPDRKGGGTNTDASAPDSGAAEGASGPGGAAGTGGGGAGSSGLSPAPAPVTPSPSTPSRERAPQRDREPAPEPEPAGETVSGQLLSSTAPPVVPQREVAARTGTPRSGDDGEPAPVPEWVWALLAVGALAGVGWVVDQGRLARLNWGSPSP